MPFTGSVSPIASGIATALNQQTTINTQLTQLAGRNKIINGSMIIDQRLAGAATTPTAGAYSIDRWLLVCTQSSKLTLQQNAGSVTPPVGFQTYLGVTVASAYTPISTDAFTLSQRIEAVNLSDLNWGTANAQPLSLQFQVYSSLTGTFSGSIYGGNTRSYVFNFAITQANTWTTIKIQNIPGDTTGTWTLSGNTSGMELRFNLGSGTNSVGTAGTWLGTNSTMASGSVNMVATAGAKFYVTGVQLETGSICTPYEQRPYAVELALCQRYFEILYGRIVWNSGGGTGSQYCWWMFKVQKRANPTVYYGSGAAYSAADTANTQMVGVLGNASSNAIIGTGAYADSDL